MVLNLQTFIFILFVIIFAHGLSLTPSDFSTNSNFSAIISKISQEIDSQGRSFLDWDTSITFYQNLVIQYPYLAREYRNIGSTEEGNPIYALHMSYKYTTAVDNLGITDTSEFLSDTSKPSIIIVGGHWGNSLISHTYIMGLIAKLIHGFHENDTKIINLLKLRHIWFIPFLNIDTYKYIQSYAGDITDVQTMVKNRKTAGSCNSKEFGVNLMNNYAYQWGKDNFGSSAVE